jgi:PD-(D/E)XK nuclease superfamily
MIWSVSTAKMFERCQRQWFFKTHFANAKAKDEIRQLAYRLSRLQSLSAWRGSVVDQVLSREVMPAFERGWPMPAETALASAMARFDRQLEIGRAHHLHQPGLRLRDEDFVAFHRLEYGECLSEREIEQAREEVRCAIANFFSMEELTARLNAADRLITQRSLNFTHADTCVRAVPDLIVFKGNAAPAILDWKVHAFGRRDAWLQLAVYAAALTRCNPHRDFPFVAGQLSETKIELLEVQLLTRTVRSHHLTEEQIACADVYIAQSAESMLLAVDGMNDKLSSLPPTDFPATRYASVCERCPYRSLCWETLQ